MKKTAITILSLGVACALQAAPNATIQYCDNNRNLAVQQSINQMNLVIHDIVTNEVGEVLPVMVTNEVERILPVLVPSEIDRVLPGMITNDANAIIPGLVTNKASQIIPSMVANEIESTLPTEIYNKANSILPSVIDDKLDDILPQAVTNEVDRYMEEAGLPTVITNTIVETHTVSNNYVVSTNIYTHETIYETMIITNDVIINVQTNIVLHYEADLEARAAIATLTGRVDTIEVNLNNLSNRVNEIANGNPIPYVDKNNVTYNNITYYTLGSPNGRVRVVTPTDNPVSLKYKIYPEPGATLARDYWEFVPSYVSSNIDGMMLHYVPTKTNVVRAAQWNQYYTGWVYIPRDMYWQNGGLYLVVDTYYQNTRRGQIKMRFSGTGVMQYPNVIPNPRSSTDSPSDSTSYSRMYFVSRTGDIMASVTTQLGYIRTVESQSQGIIWFPDTPTTEQQIVIDWINSWPQ